MLEEYEMESTTAGTTAAGVTSPTQRRSNETKIFSPSTQISGHQKSTLQEAPAELSPNELDGVPTNTDQVEDFDALLASLESDNEEVLSIKDKIQTFGEARPIPSVLLETSPNRGLDDAEVLSRRKRYGWNMLKEEKRSHLKTFLMFFVGPIQCVMLVSSHHPFPPANSPPPKTSKFPAEMTL